MTQTGKKFPSISVNAIDYLGEQKEINLFELAREKNSKIVLFWYPKDFTFVCPTEILAFQAKLEEFKKRNTIVIGASVDSAEVHFAWLNTPKDNGGIEGVTFDLLSDSNRNLSETLGILDGGILEDENGDFLRSGDYVTYRATYLIDEEGEVFHESVNHMPLGRNVDEFIRLIDAYTHVQTHGEVCPANWNEGDDAMKADRDGVADYLKTH
jgi:peroxiredoxin 2/4